MAKVNYFYLLAFLLQICLIGVILFSRGLMTNCADCFFEPFHTRLILFVFLFIAVILLIVLWTRKHNYGSDRLYILTNDVSGVVSRGIYINTMGYTLQIYTAFFGIILFGFITSMLYFLYFYQDLLCHSYMHEFKYNKTDMDDKHFNAFAENLSIMLLHMIIVIFVSIEIPFICQISKYTHMNRWQICHHFLPIIAGANVAIWMWFFFAENKVLSPYRYDELYPPKSSHEACTTRYTNIYTFMSQIENFTFPVAMEFALAAIEVLIHIWLMPFPETDIGTNEHGDEETEQDLANNQPDEQAGEPAESNTCSSIGVITTLGHPIIIQLKTNSNLPRVSFVNLDERRDIAVPGVSEHPVSVDEESGGAEVDEVGQGGRAHDSVNQEAGGAEQSNPSTSRAGVVNAESGPNIEHEDEVDEGDDSESTHLLSQARQSNINIYDRTMTCISRASVFLLSQFTELLYLVMTKLQMLFSVFNVYTAVLMGVIYISNSIIFVLFTERSYLTLRELVETIRLPLSIESICFHLLATLVCANCLVIICKSTSSRDNTSINASDTIIIFALLCRISYTLLKIIVYSSKVSQYGHQGATAHNWTLIENGTDLPSSVPPTKMTLTNYEHVIDQLSIAECSSTLPHYFLQAVIIYKGERLCALVSDPSYDSLQNNISFLAMLSLVMWVKASFLEHISNEVIHSQFMNITGWESICAFLLPPYIFFLFTSVHKLIKVKNNFREDEIRFCMINEHPRAHVAAPQLPAV